MKRNQMTFVAVGVPLFLLTVGLSVASADTFDYTINTGDSAIAGLGPYATVAVDLTSANTATITFTADTGFKLGDSGMGTGGFGVNVNASSWAVSNFDPATYKNNNASSLDGTGSYNQTFYENGGFGSSVTMFSFTVTDTSGTWASAANVLTPDSGGALGNFAVAAHVFVCSSPSCSSAPNTGYAGGTPSVPDGGMTLMLLGSALVGLEGLRRKLRA